jgi:hypothetical protein
LSGLTDKIYKSIDEGLSWLQDPGFPFKKDVGDFIEQITPLLKEEKRCALI